MSNQQHTPGPWKVDGTGMAIYSANENLTFAPMVAAAIGNEKSLDQLRADARLIAAAPELLAALESMLHLRKMPDEVAECVLDRAVAAIAKAKGEQK